MRSYIIAIFSGFFCSGAYGQVQIEYFAERYIHDDINTYSPGSESVFSMECLPPALAFMAGIAAWECNGSEPNKESTDWGSTDSPAVLGKWSNHTVTHSISGEADHIYYHLMVTTFRPELLMDVVARKRVIFADIESLDLMYELRVYQFSDSGGNSLQYVLWKTLSTADYLKLVARNKG